MRKTLANVLCWSNFYFAEWFFLVKNWNVCQIDNNFIYPAWKSLDQVLTITSSWTSKPSFSRIWEKWFQHLHHWSWPWRGYLWGFSELKVNLKELPLLLDSKERLICCAHHIKYEISQRNPWKSVSVHNTIVNKYYKIQNIRIIMLEFPVTCGDPFEQIHRPISNYE